MGSNAQCPLANGQIYNAQCPLPNAQVHKSMPKSRPYPQISWDLDHINLNRIPFLALDSSLLWPLPSTSFGLLSVFTHKGSIKRSVLESHTRGIPFLALDSSLLWPLPSTSSSLLSVLYVIWPDLCDQWPQVIWSYVHIPIWTFEHKYNSEVGGRGGSP